AIAEPGVHRDPAELARLMLKHRVGTLHFVPSMLAEFVNQPELPAFPDLKRIVCSGEALPADLQQRVFQRLPGVELDNLYGPTEAAIDVTHWTCRDDGNHSVPIGQPIANSQIHILDAHLNPLPAGIAGELYIGGRGLARGYHRRSGLTAERFIPDPFGSGERLYRTGDKAKWRNDGVIEYLGRLDHQIKLRGLRIELGEIEAALMAQTGITEAAVLLKDSPHGPRLVAYAAAGRLVEVETLQQGLRQRLPDYMVPNAIVILDSLPKTVNGKLDRKALPEPELNRGDYRAPQTGTEQRLADVWQSLLGVERVGRNDNFFELGGHSLLATRLVAQIRIDLGVDLPLRNVFETEELRQLAERIDQLGAALVGDEVLADMSGWLDELELS
ncbi:AMP-binding protein, partial [Methylomonas rivi]